ncbi:MAG: oligosaccharide flippase family protein [Phycisphaeraceae bacterium]
MSTAARSTPALAQLSLRTLALRGSAWTFLGFGLAQALRLASHLILARLLFPEVFGLMALVAVFLQGLEMFSDVGIGPSIIQNKRGDDRSFLATAWSIQIIRGFLLTAIALAAAWPFAAFYGEPQLGPLISVAAFAATLAGFNSTGIFSANRHMAIGRITLLDLLSQSVAIAVMITWAWYYRTVWALVGGGLVAAGLKMLFSHVLWPGRDRLGWNWEAARSLFSFGKWIFATSAVNFLAAQGHRLLLGAYLVMAELGIFAIAYHLTDVLRGVVSKLTHSVMFPALSRTFRDNPERVKSVFYRARLLSDAMLLPAVGVLAATGPAVVALLYDDRYAQAGWMLQILALRVAISCTTLFGGACLLAAGNPRYGLVTNSVQSVWIFAGVPLIWPAYGLYGALWVLATANISTAFIVAWGLHRYGVLSIWHEIRALAFLAVGVCVGTLFNPALEGLVGALS